jgi:hypothetical protein
MHPGVSYGTNPWAGCRSSGRIAEMRPGLLVSGRPFLPFVSVHIYPHWQSYRSEPVVAKNSLLMLWVITSPPVPPTRVPRRLRTGRLIRLLMTFFAQPTRLNSQQGSSSYPNLHGHLHYPNDLDGPLMRLSLTKYESTALTIRPAVSSPRLQHYRLTSI